MKNLLVVTCALALVGCESDNDHFCAKYSYYYTELTQPDILPLFEIKRQLTAELEKKPSDKTRMMLFVLDEIDAEVKPASETAQAYCQRRARWTAFNSRR